MKKTVLFVLLFILFMSCSKNDDNLYLGPIKILINSEYAFIVDYVGPWSGNYISNNYIYSITNYGSQEYSNISGMVIRKEDNTTKTLSLTKVLYDLYDSGLEKKVEIKRVTQSNNYIRIE